MHTFGSFHLSYEYAEKQAKDIKKILGENLLRVFAEVQNTSIRTP